MSGTKNILLEDYLKSYNLSALSSMLSNTHCDTVNMTINSTVCSFEQAVEVIHIIGDSKQQIIPHIYGIPKGNLNLLIFGANWSKRILKNDILCEVYHEQVDIEEIVRLVCNNGKRVYKDYIISMLRKAYAPHVSKETMANIESGGKVMLKLEEVEGWRIQK